MVHERVPVVQAVADDENARTIASNNSVYSKQDSKGTQITSQGFEEVNASESRPRRHER